jgi:large subunit ribosomal protein L6
MVDIPEGVTVDVEGTSLKAMGPNGELSRSFMKTIELEIDGGSVNVKGENLAYVNTVKAHITNMVKGVNEGFTKRMKILYAHFPITIEMKGKDVLIKNFLGERDPRKTKIAGDATKLEVKGQDITISGPDKEGVGQTAANLISVTRIHKKDPRIFQDGIYIVK